MLANKLRSTFSRKSHVVASKSVFHIVGFAPPQNGQLAFLDSNTVYNNKLPIWVHWDTRFASVEYSLVWLNGNPTMKLCLNKTLSLGVFQGAHVCCDEGEFDKRYKDFVKRNQLESLMCYKPPNEEAVSAHARWLEDMNLWYLTHKSRIRETNTCIEQCYASKKRKRHPIIVTDELGMPSSCPGGISSLCPGGCFV